MRIICLTADASTNSLVRVVPIAKVLARSHDVTIAGFRSQPSVFGQYAQDFEFRTLQTQNLPGFLRQVGGLARSLDADLIYAFKPLATSLWPGLAATRRLGVPLALDIEDWEVGWYLDQRWPDRLKHLAHIERPNGLAWSLLSERLAHFAEHRFVVSRFLQSRFGGVLLSHGPDMSLFDPERWDREAALQEFGLDDLDYVLFAGTPMPSKGLEELLTALQRLNRPDTRMLIVGSTSHDPAYCAQLEARFGDVLMMTGARPHSAMPALLSLATVVALPQRVTHETIGQVPGKVFEAMAMARAIVATAVSDLPEILDGCGRVVAPGDAAALEAALAELLDNAELRRELGDRARRRCQERYGWDAMEATLASAFSSASGRAS
jgi:glycosyltransferase involved in cell wall biosynthesis